MEKLTWVLGSFAILATLVSAGLFIHLEIKSVIEAIHKEDIKSGKIMVEINGIKEEIENIQSRIGTIQNGTARIENGAREIKDLIGKIQDDLLSKISHTLPTIEELQRRRNLRING